MAWVLPVAMGLQALGSFYSTHSANSNADKQRQQYLQLQQLITGQMQKGPSSIEDLIGQRYAQGGGNDILSGLNTSTDPIIQSMRNGPNDSFLNTQLQGITSTGNPFDMSNILSTLQPLRDRRLAADQATLLAGAPGLGQRFGTAKLRQSSNLALQSQQDQAAQDAQLVYQGYTDAQNRRLTAAGLLNNRDQIQLGRDQGAISALQGNAQLGLTAQSQNDSILQLLLGASQNRQQQNNQLLGILGGQQVPAGPPGYGGSISDIGQLLMISQLLGKQNNTNPYGFAPGQQVQY